MGNYNAGGENKGKVVHCRRNRDNNKIEALRGLYEEPKEDDTTMTVTMTKTMAIGITWRRRNGRRTMTTTMM